MSDDTNDNDNKPSGNPVRPFTIIGGDAILTVKQAAEMTPFGMVTLRAALDDGSLEGRKIGGPTGWVTTWQALLRWAAGRGVEVRVPAAATDREPPAAPPPPAAPTPPPKRAMFEPSMPDEDEDRNGFVSDKRSR